MLEQIPVGFWQGLGTALSGIGGYFLLRIRTRRRPPPPQLPPPAHPIEPVVDQITERLRDFVSQTAVDKVKAEVGPLLIRVEAVRKDLERVETELRAHMLRTQDDVRAFYVLTGRLTAEVEGLRGEMVRSVGKLDDLLGAVGRLEGVQLAQSGKGIQ